MWGWPESDLGVIDGLVCSPRVWGWPATFASGSPVSDVFPTGVGMARVSCNGEKL